MAIDGWRRRRRISFLGCPITDACLFGPSDHWRFPFWDARSLTLAFLSNAITDAWWAITDASPFGKTYFGLDFKNKPSIVFLLNIKLKIFSFILSVDTMQSNLPLNLFEVQSIFQLYFDSITTWNAWMEIHSNMHLPFHCQNESKRSISVRQY